MPDIKPDLLRDAVAYLDRWLSFQQQLKEIPAVTVAVLHGDELLLSAGYGHASLEDETPATPAHIFRVASHSKWFTATAIMQLQEAGKLRLDDPLGRFIPWLREPLAGATVRQVLNHAAGIVRDGYENDFWQLEQPFPDAGVLRTLVEDGGDVLPPNWKLKYSNIGYSLLGLVVEAVDGVPYNQYMRGQIIDRLGLTSTGPETNDEARARMVTGYSPRTLPGSRLPLPDVETGAMSPATGFYSTAEDLVRFGAAHFFGNDTLIGDNAKREMQRPYWWVENQGGYGLGMDVATIGERRVVGHSGGFPGHTTRTSLDPTDRLAISILTSESAGIAGTLMQAAVKLINLAQSQEPARDAAALDRYTGRFVSLWGFLDIVRLGNQLFAIGPNVDDPTVQPVKLEVMEEDVLKIEETDSFGSPGERVTYQRDAEGTVTKLIFAGSTQYPEGTMQDYLERRRRELAAG